MHSSLSFSLNSMRGYRKLKQNNNLGLNYRVMCAFSASRFGFNTLSGLKRFLPSIDIADLHLNQYLLTCYYSGPFNQTLLAYHAAPEPKKIIYALPREYQEILQKEGMGVQNFLCSVLWFRFCFMSWIKGIVIFVVTVFRNLKNIFYFKGDQRANDYVVFTSITANCIPIAESKNSNCLISWYLNKILNERSNTEYLVKTKIPDIRHTAKGVKTSQYKDSSISWVPSPVSGLSSFTSLIEFIAISLIKIAQSFFYLVIGKWHLALLLPEIIRACQQKNADKKKLPSAVFFNNSTWIYRPLWTYTAAKQGVSICFYFYSTNVKLLNGKLNYGWDIVTWPEYWAWDMYQKHFIEENSPVEAKVDIVGPVLFEDTDVYLPDITENTIAIFDVQPVRHSIYVNLGLEDEYYTPELSKSFFTDLLDCARSCNYRLLLKRKREMGKLLHPKYRMFLSEIFSGNDIKELEATVSPIRIIGKVKGVVCMPFTSVGLLAASLGKPVIFYDPKGYIQKDNPEMSHGLPVINTKEELQNWIISL